MNPEEKIDVDDGVCHDPHHLDPDHYHERPRCSPCLRCGANIQSGKMTQHVDRGCKSGIETLRQYAKGL